MKILFFLLLLISSFSHAALFSIRNRPSPSDNFGEAIEDTTATMNQLTPNQEIEQKQEQRKEDELLENHYNVPDDEEEREFNKNGH